MSVPLQIYDFIAIVLPATIVLTLIRQELPKLSLWNLGYDYGGVAVIFLVAYLLGHLIHIYARWFEKWKLTKLFFYHEPPLAKPGKMILNGRKSPVIVSDKLGQAILVSLSEFYGFNVTKDDDGLFDLVYAPIYDRMVKRDIFMSLTNMFRSLVVISIVYGCYLFGKTIYMSVQHHVVEIGLVIYFIIDVAFFLGLRSGYNYNKLLSEAIPYTSFLAWYKQLKA